MSWHSELVTFETCNGNVMIDEAIVLRSPLVGPYKQAYLLEDSPLALSLGESVTQDGRGFIWLPGTLPYIITDASHVRVACPAKFRIYADRIEENIPIFKDTVRLGAYSKVTASMYNLQTAARAAAAKLSATTAA